MQMSETHSCSLHPYFRNAGSIINADPELTGSTRLLMTRSQITAVGRRQCAET